MTKISFSEGPKKKNIFVEM
ncbi:hypothetical protein [Sicyoidochytrium minutum DNA virus]|nr:hypothetical protein [Sicyoidochytrium minutum DNA virus]